ncbi:MAG: hypothetical protein R2825_06870 [Saprospiraceae bacterium]
MKRPILVTLFFILIVVANLVAQVDYLKTYGLPNRNENLVAIHPAAEPGQFWAAGLTGSVGQDDFLLLKLDSAGQVLWADTLGSPLHNENIFAFDRDPVTGAMWIAGNRTLFGDRLQEPVLLRLDSSGTVTTEIFEADSYNSSYGMYSVKALADGGAMAYQTDPGTKTPILRRYDAAGTLLWSEQFIDANNNRPYQSFAELPDGRFFTIRPYGSFSGNSYRAEVSLRSATNSIIWKTDVQSPTGANTTRAGSILYDPTDTTLIVFHWENQNKRFLTKIGTDMQVRWQVQTESLQSSLYQHPYLFTGPDNAIGVLYEQGIELRNPETGALVQSSDLSGGSQDWGKSLRGAAFSPFGNIATVGKTTATASSDGYYGLLHGTDFTVLEEAPIGTDGLRDDDVNPLVTATDDHIFLLSYADFGLAKSWDIVLRKIEEATGEEVWINNYGSSGNDRNQDILVLSDGNLLLMARQENAADTSRMLFLKINPANGDVIWESIQPNWGAQYTIRGAATPDGGAVVVFQGSIPYPSAPGGFASWQLQGLRLSPTGEVVWREWFEPTWSPVLTPGNSYIEDVVALQDGSMLAMGLEEESSGLVLRIDAENGSIMFATTLDSVASSNDRRVISAVEAPNGDLLVMSRNYNYTDSLWLYRLSPDGAILLRKSLKYGEFHHGSSFHRAPDGGLLLVLSFRNGSFFSAPSGLRVLRMTDDFDVLSETILYDDELRPNDALVMSDGSLALTGFIRPTNSDDMFLMKTLPVPLVATNELWAKSSLQVFPNPVTTGQELNISLENDYRGRVKIDFLGLDGRMLQSFFEEKAEQQLHVSKELPSSFAGNLFIVRVSDGEGSAARVVVRF